jgi:hypothetical protein
MNVKIINFIPLLSSGEGGSGKRSNYLTPAFHLIPIPSP